MREITAEEIRALVGGELRGDGDRVVDSVAPLDRATPRALTFVAAARYLPYLQATRAGVVLLRADLVDQLPDGCVAVVVKDPHVALYTVLRHVYPRAEIEPGVHGTAVIASSARIHQDASVGPFAVVGDDVQIGAGCVIGAHVVLGEGCTLGREVRIHPHATLYPGVIVRDRAIIHSGARIGRDGFGFVWHDGGHRKIPQVGGCVIEEDVEIGANTTIDRGSMGDTIVGVGTKIDNLVQIGHNVRIGKHAILSGQAGLSGSTTVGDGVAIGGQAGIAGHLSIGAGARIGAQGGVTSDVPAGETYSGYPARPHREALRAQAGLFKLPELFRRLKRLEAAVFGDNGD